MSVESVKCHKHNYKLMDFIIHAQTQIDEANDNL